MTTPPGDCPHQPAYLSHSVSEAAGMLASQLAYLLYYRESAGQEAAEAVQEGWQHALEWVEGDRRYFFTYVCIGLEKLFEQNREVIAQRQADVTEERGRQWLIHRTAIVDFLDRLRAQLTYDGEARDVSVLMAMVMEWLRQRYE